MSQREAAMTGLGATGNIGSDANVSLLGYGTEMIQHRNSFIITGM
jgi:hypothetical protein